MSRVGAGVRPAASARTARCPPAPWRTDQGPGGCTSVGRAPNHRGRGLARAVASVAAADGVANHLLPQWGARPEPSRRVARALGFRQLGAQLSIRIGT
ncbi:GNAT family N-acetyltransferase [Micromonospora sp. NPDC049497]|uniref:GNAT family N-acetyltransferase n=1 Tax=Micromonospora sp. NPDC049497 TaxID=3364273 RepID=UPI0037996CA7